MNQKSKGQRDRFLGIDLGTTFSSVAYIDFPPSSESEKPRFEPVNVQLDMSTGSNSNLQKSDDVYLLPTLVDYGPSIPEVGKRVSENEKFIIDEFKLNLGLNKPAYELPNGQQKRSEDVAIAVLRFLKRRAEDFLSPSIIARVCLAMPSTDYENYQIDKTGLMSKLGQDAGFRSINVIEEPLAAILDVDYTTGGILTQADKIVMVIDYGGGTCDVAIVKASYKKFLWSTPPKPLGLGTEKCEASLLMMR